MSETSWFTEALLRAGFGEGVADLPRQVWLALFDGDREISGGGYRRQFMPVTIDRDGARNSGVVRFSDLLAGRVGGAWLMDAETGGRRIASVETPARKLFQGDAIEAKPGDIHITMVHAR